ncbi:uncharacterized protein LOC121865331 [Homarus americanus]|uniref:uncharacterized protein LOC121865331 n=1 Tax=Homarus americanus TaxID=6706 RepID=UPI001C43B155|nr:uncharacterized protein LOC121865331 [Homarus americanus]
MENAELKKTLIRDCCSVVREEEGLTTYEVEAKDFLKDEENKIQVMAIGPVNEGPLQSVLLLGETGAGKTRVINAFINHLFGVLLEDKFRFQVKDYVGRDNLLKVESQTEYITAYIIYHQPGMPRENNYMLIDTPGFNDTRKDHESVTLKRLTAFLTNDFGVDDLSCVGLVAKANQNRILPYQLQMLKEFTSVLGSNVGDITQLMATYASDDTPAVIEVVRHAGVQFMNMYQLDNWPLYVTHALNLSEEDRHMHLKYRWNNMQAQYDKFFEGLQNSPSVSLKRTRDLLQETKLLEERKVLLMNSVRYAVELKTTIINQYNSNKDMENLAKEIIWKEVEVKHLTVKTPLPFGYHAHNCKICQKTCIHDCKNPNNLCAKVLGTGTGVGTAGVIGVGTSVGTGALVGAEMGIFGGPIGVAVGGGLGTIAGLATGLTVGYLKRKTIENCPIGSSEMCNHGECSHSKADHKNEYEKYVTHEILEEKINDVEKMRYDEIMNKISMFEEQIKEDEECVNGVKEDLIIHARHLVKHTNKINELSLGNKTLNPLSIIDEIIMVEKENTQHVELLKMVKRAVIMMSGSNGSSSGGECSDICVRKLENLYNDAD